LNVDEDGEKLPFYVKAYNGVLLPPNMSEAVSAPAVCKIDYVPLDPGYTSVPQLFSHTSNLITIEWNESNGCGGIDNLECTYSITVSEDGNLSSE
jgi:hypothetical protein